MERLPRALRGAAGGYLTRAQQPVTLGDYSEPVPDIALVRPRADDYLHRHPLAGDVFQIIEVSDTSLCYDVDVKVPLFAKHGIPEVWVVDLADRRIMLWRRARSAAYQMHETADETALVAAVDLPQARVDFSIVLALTRRAGSAARLRVLP